MAKTPKHCHHKGRELGYVNDRGKVIYFRGRWPADKAEAPPEVEAQYQAWLTKWLAKQKGEKDQAEAAPVPISEATVANLINEFDEWVKTTRTAKEYQPIVKHITEFFKEYDPKLELLVNDVTAKHIEKFRDWLIKKGRGYLEKKEKRTKYTRSGLNVTIRRVRRIFRWGNEGRDLVSDAVLKRVCAVKPIPEDRYHPDLVPESKHRDTGVTEEVFNQTIAHLEEPVKTMALLCWWSGMRVSECCNLTMKEIEQTPEAWFYCPARHKTRRHGHKRIVTFGPKCQALLQPFLRKDDLPLFSPKERVAAFREEQRANRKTKVQPSQEDRSKADPKRTPGNAYDKHSFGKAIKRVCLKHGIPVWSPGQLRKNAAQRLYENFGLEIGAKLLGHSPEVARRHYLEPDKLAAARVAQAIL